MKEFKEIEPEWRKTWSCNHEYFKSLLLAGVHNKFDLVNKQKWVRKLVKWWNTEGEPSSSSVSDEDGPGSAVIISSDGEEDVKEKNKDEGEQPAEDVVVKEQEGTEGVNNQKEVDLAPHQHFPIDFT